MTTGSRDFPLDANPFLRQSTDPEPRGGTLQGRPAPTLRSTHRSYAENVPTGKAAETVAKTLEGWDRYCALALSLDNPETSQVPESLDRILLNLIEEAKQHQGAVGCPWHEQLYFIALPSDHTPAAHQFARQIQAKLATQRPETISIGIAPFPLLTFDRQHSWANTCKALAHAAFLGPGSIVELNAVSLNISGDQHFQRGEMDEAIAEYRAALELDSNDTNVLNSLGVCLAEVDDIAAAKTAFKTVQKIDPSEPMAHYNLGMLYQLDHNPKEALTHFQQAHATNHGFFEIPFQIGKILSQQCRWEDALHFAEKALVLNQGHGAVYALKGLCLAAMEKRPEAIAAYTQSVKINPNNADALSALGCLYDAQNENPDICRSFLEQSVALAPNNGLYHHRLGRWHQKHQQFEEAKAAYRQAIAWGHDTAGQMAVVEKELKTETMPTKLRTG